MNIDLTSLRKLGFALQTFYCLLLTLVGSLVAALLAHETGYHGAAFIMLIGNLLLAVLFEFVPVFIACAASALVWNFFFIPPTFTFHIANTEDNLLFFLYFMVSLVNAALNLMIRREEKKSKDREQKAHSNLLYQTLFNSLSHELKTPIATIIGASDALLEEGAKLPENKKRELIQSIANSGVRLQREVQNLLNMSRIESGEMHPKMDWCDANDIITQMREEFSDEATVLWKVNIPDNFPLIKTDIGLLIQALQNVIHNAHRYGKPNSPIDLTFIPISIGIEFRIRDYGNGVPEHLQKEVFSKFYRLPNTNISGSGLGLSISKGFIEALGGTIYCHTPKNGEGAEFVLILPCDLSYINSLDHE